jgi:hypothetical protein
MKKQRLIPLYDGGRDPCLVLATSGHMNTAS